MPNARAVRDHQSASGTRHDLVASTTRLGNHLLQLLNLCLCAAESSELDVVLAPKRTLEATCWGIAYPLLCELAAALVLSIADQLNDTLLVGRKTGNLLDQGSDEVGALAKVALHAAHALGVDTGSGFLIGQGVSRCRSQAFVRRRSKNRGDQEGRE